MPGISPEALKARSDRLRDLRIHRRTDLTLDDLADWLNPIIAGWMHYGRYYRSELDPLLRRVDTYLQALGWEEVQAAADLHAVQAVVGRAYEESQPCSPTGSGSARTDRPVRRAG